MTDLDSRGFAIADVALTPEQCDHIAASLPAVTGGRGGVRGLITHPTVLQLLGHQQLGACLWSIVGRELVALKATLFDRTPEANWRLQWHQDREIAIRERMHVAGYGPWSTKAGVPHVEPPDSVLQQMLAVRIYLDDSGPENGPLAVIPGSHDRGKLSEPDLERLVASSTPVDVHARKGSLVVMRPLLVHCSRPWRSGEHQRVIHVEFGPPDAVSPLYFHTAVQLKRSA